MPRVTRSSAHASSSKTPNMEAGTSTQNGTVPEEVEESDVLSNFQALIPQLSSAARALQREVITLRNKNKALVERLEEEDVAVQPRKGTKSGRDQLVRKLEGEKRELKTRIRKLEKAREKDKQKIDKLRMREAQADAADLRSTEFEVGDTAHRMKKLLRRFSDIVVSTSLDQDEECPICMEAMESKKCISLPCEHIFCISCISHLPGAAMSEVDEDPIPLRCPTCRNTCLADEIEVVQYTASQQWDALLEVAEDFAKMDRMRREQETSDEEASEEFIDDGEGNASSALSDAPTDEVGPHDPPEAEPEREPSEELLSLPLPKKRRIAIASDSEPEPELFLHDTIKAEVDADSAGPTAEPSTNGTSETNAEFVQGSSRAQTPPPTTASIQATPSYAQSPSSLKRKKLESLAAQRKSKRR